MDKRWDQLFDLLSHGTFPAGYDKSQKLNLRRYASKFTLKEGELYVRGRRAIKSKEDARKLFTEFHSSPIGGHSGILKTRTAMSSRFYWLGMSVDINNWVLECDKCQVGRPSTAAQPLQSIQVSAVWDLVGIDLIGPLPKTVDGFQYIFTATDYFSKWVEAFPLKTKTAAEVGRHICSIIYRHGCPKTILSGQGREFVNELNTSLCNMLAIERSVTAAYHPQTNGLDVKTNHNIEQALTKLVNDKQNNWDVFLEATLFSLRSKMQTTTKHSPFLMMYGREAVFPSEVPVDMPLSTINLPEERTYHSFLDEKIKSMECVKKRTAENLSKSQDKRKQAYAKRVQKKNQNTLSDIGEDVLWFKVKRERKESKIEPGMHGCM